MKANTPYEIQVEGTIGAQWDRRLFPGLDINSEQAVVTTIIAQIPDAAALRGLVNYLWDLNLNIISFQRMPHKNDHDKKEQSDEN